MKCKLCKVHLCPSRDAISQHLDIDDSITCHSCSNEFFHKYTYIEFCHIHKIKPSKKVFKKLMKQIK